MNTINELIEKAHSQAKEMGWWDQPRNTGELLMLIVSECGEALEAHRSGKQANVPLHDYLTTHGEPHDDPSSDRWINSFKTNIKDTFEDELADIVIRIADLAGGMDMKIRCSIIDSIPSTGNVGEDLMFVTECIAMLGIDKRTKGVWLDDWLSTAMAAVSGIAKAHNIDLWRHIELKLAYNRTRGVRHGKAY